MKAMGQSMFPMIPEGTCLFFDPPGEFRVGDVVLTEVQGRVLAHRVIRIRGEEILTRGDWNHYSDPPCSRQDVKARCVLMLRKGVVVRPDWPALRILGLLLCHAVPWTRRLLTLQRGST